MLSMAICWLELMMVTLGLMVYREMVCSLKGFQQAETLCPATTAVFFLRSAVLLRRNHLWLHLL
jgi:hypothetical protein